MLVSIFHTHNQLNSRNATGMRAMLLAFTFIALALIGFGGAYASSPSTRAEQVANMRVATGVYVGNGMDNRALSGLGFQPDVVWHQDAEGAHVMYARQPAGQVGWTVPEVVGDVASSEIPLDRPVVSAGTPTNVYVFWTWQSQFVDPGTGMYTIQVKYRVWDGGAWSAILDRGAVNSYNDSNQYVSVDWNTNVAHVAWVEGTGSILYASAPQTVVDLVNIHRPGVEGPVCRLTEYYDTTQNLRIYYTRTFPNAPESTWGIVENRV